MNYNEPQLFCRYILILFPNSNKQLQNSEQITISRLLKFIVFYCENTFRLGSSKNNINFLMIVKALQSYTKLQIIE